MHLSRCCALFLFAACATTPAAPPAPAAIELGGSITWEGHYDRPHATRTYPASLRLLRSGERARCELLEGEPGPDAESTVFVRDERGACWVLPHGGPRFVPDRGDGGRLLQLLLAATTDTAPSDQGIAFQHPRLGEVADRATWDSAASTPELRVLWHRPHDHAQLVLHRTTTTAIAPDATAAFEVGDPQPAPAHAPAPPRFRTLAPGVHEIVLPDADSRSLAVEFEDHVVLCETSMDNPAGERLLAALDEHLPGKPVRHVLFGHYHPHYTGGLRPFLARGAIVAAPPLGAEFAREIAARPFRSPPDALAASGHTPVIEPFTGQRTFHDATNDLVAIDIGADSHHTAEYVVFWLPRQRLLFQGDLGWFAGASGLRAGGQRARGLMKAIDDRQLPVETLVQSWPTLGAPTLPLAELRALLAK